MSTKRCFACGEIKSLEDFHKHRGRKDGHNDVCKGCANRRVSLYSRTEGAKAVRAKFFAEYKERPEARERLQSYHRTYQDNLTPEQRGKYQETRYRREAKTPRNSLYRMLYAAARRRPTEEIATIDDLMEMWETQGGRCAVSGIPMTWSKPVKDGKKVPTSVSLDRIDPKGGYDRANLRLVCWQVNMFKNEWSDEQMFAMALAIVSNMKKPKFSIVA